MECRKYSYREALKQSNRPRISPIDHYRVKATDAPALEVFQKASDEFQWLSSANWFHSSFPGALFVDFVLLLCSFSASSCCFPIPCFFSLLLVIFLSIVHLPGPHQRADTCLL